MFVKYIFISLLSLVFLLGVLIYVWLEVDHIETKVIEVDKDVESINTMKDILDKEQDKLLDKGDD